MRSAIRNFEVDQRNAGGALVNPSNGTFLLDRWSVSRTGTMAINTQQVNLGISPNLVVPGTSFQISKNYLSSVLSTQQASLGAGDVWQLQQIVEGPTLRELVSDVTSFSLLVSSSVAGLKFSVAIRDSGPATKSLVKLCTIPTASTWTLIQLPNLPVFPSGNFSLNPGAVGYVINICLAAGSTWMAPAADTWQNGSFTGAPGMSNFANSPVNSVFQVAFLQHEPGAVCSTFIDKPFGQNYDECLRYYQKSYDYDVAVGTANAVGEIVLTQTATTSISGPVRFHKPMAKVPVGVAYNSATGAVNSVRLTGIDYAVTSFNFLGKAGFSGLITGTLPAVVAGAYGRFHCITDTTW